MNRHERRFMRFILPAMLASAVSASSLASADTLFTVTGSLNVGRDAHSATRDLRATLKTERARMEEIVREETRATILTIAEDIRTVTQTQVEGWMVDLDDPPPDPERLSAETPVKIARWNELGRTLCSAFLETAERMLARAA